MRKIFESFSFKINPSIKSHNDLTGIAKIYTEIDRSETRVVEDLFDFNNRDREANIANELDLNTVTTEMANDAAVQIYSFTQQYLKNKRNLPNKFIVYRAGKIVYISGVTLDKNVAERHSKLNEFPVISYEIERHKILADIKALNPFGYVESELLIYGKDLKIY